MPTSEDDEEAFIEILDEDVEDDEDFEPPSRGFNKSRDRDDDSDDDSDEIVDDWSHTMRSDFPPPKRRKSGQDGKYKVVAGSNRDVLVLSD